MSAISDGKYIDFILSTVSTLTPEEIRQVMAFVSTLKSQCNQVPVDGRNQTNRQ